MANHKISPTDIFSSGFVRITGKFMKKIAHKKMRRAKNIPSGGAYKKVYGPWEWS